MSVPEDQLPRIPGWVPPLDTGQPSAADLNDLGRLPKATFAARNSIIPITYGRDRLYGKPFVIHVDESLPLAQPLFDPPPPSLVQ